ncbi:MAG: redoxin family protein [Bacteroidota bacterium]
MEKTIKYIALATLCLFFAQAGAQIKPLKIGDQLPDFTINNIINSDRNSVKLSEFKDKLLILDFWATWCGTCIPSLVKLDSLQQVFKKELVIMPVTYQPAAMAEPFLKKRSIRLPSVTSDLLLKSFFPHKSVPHQVWILNGKVQAITSHYSATAQNIKEMLAKSDKSNMVMKLDQTDFKSTEPLLVGGNGGAGKELKYQSMLTGYVDGIGYHNLMSSGQIMITNNSIDHLYRKAFEKQYSWTRLDNRILVELNADIRDRVRLPNHITGEDKLRWFKSNGYSFNFALPGEQDVHAMAAMMQDDLNRFFGLKENIFGRVEPRSVQVLVLTIENEDLLKKPAPPSAPLNAGKSLISKNRPLSKFVEMLGTAFQSQPLPIMDESGNNDLADISLNVSSGDIQALQIELKRYGLKLTKQKRDVPMLVIGFITEKSTSIHSKTNSNE